MRGVRNVTGKTAVINAWMPYSFGGSWHRQSSTPPAVLGDQEMKFNAEETQRRR